jgi:hypothetical protein
LLNPVESNIMKTDTTTTETQIETPATVEAPKASKVKAPKAKAPKAPASEVKAKPTVRITGKMGSLAISGQGTIAELAPLLTEKTGKTWENPTATAYVNGLVAMGGAVAIGARPNPDQKRGRTAKVYDFSAKIG